MGFRKKGTIIISLEYTSLRKMAYIFVIIGFMLFTVNIVSSKVPEEVAMPVERMEAKPREADDIPIFGAEVLGAEALSSGILSYYFMGHHLNSLSYLHFKDAFGMLVEDKPAWLTPLYLTSLAESVYLMGGMLGDDGTLAGAFVGAWALPLTMPILSSMCVTGFGDEELIESAWKFGWKTGVALAPISATIGYSELFPESSSAKKEDNADIITAEFLSGYYGLALSEMGLAKLRLGLEKSLDNRRLLPLWTITTTLASSLAVYGTGELNGSEKGSLRSTLLSGIAGPAIGVTIGALTGDNENIGGCAGVFSAPLCATLGYNLFQPGKNNMDTAEVIGSYYGAAVAGTVFDYIGLEKIMSEKKFSLLKATGMACASSASVYGIGERWGEGEGSFIKASGGGIASSVAFSLIPAYFSKYSAMDEFYTRGTFFSPVSAMIGYNLSAQDIRDNIQKTEVFGGFCGGAMMGTALDWMRLKKRLPPKTFYLLEATSMAVGCSATVYGIGDEWGNEEGNFVKAFAGSIAAPVAFALIPPYFGSNSLMDEFYMVGARFSPITAMIGYERFPYDDFRIDEDNASVEAAEIASGYFGSSVAAIGFNRFGPNLKTSFKDWKSSLIRGTGQAVVSSLMVYGVGEIFGSGKGKFSDAFMGGMSGPLGLSLSPVAVLVLLGIPVALEQRLTFEDIERVLSAWNECYLIGSYLSPIFATLKYNEGISDSRDDNNSNAIFAIPILMTRF